MTQTNFHLLFSVSVLHTYYENNICKCLYFIPDEQTESMLNKYGFKIRQKTNGFDFFSSSARPDADFLNYLAKVTGTEYFNFIIESTNENFALLTELPVDWLWQLNYNSKDPLNVQGETNTLLHLTLTDQVNPPVTGNLKIYFNDVLDALGKNGPPHYLINLQARSTQWQYYVINKNSVPLNNPSIKGKGDITFKGPENVILENEVEALLFYSDSTDLLLSQVPVYKFDLVNADAGNATVKKRSSGNIVFKGLPSPDPSNMGTVIIDGKKRLTSPMYIYI